MATKAPTSKANEGQSAIDLDEVDRCILALLSEDGRLSARDLAARACIGRATAHSRLRRLQEQGVIKRFSAVVDPAKVGAGLAAYVQVKINQHAWRTVREAVAGMPGVEHVSLVSGDFDLIVLVRVHDPRDLRDVVLEKLHATPGVAATRTTFVLDEVEGAGLFARVSRPQGGLRLRSGETGT
jgi:DNA-binding Lrp family transcriptional regulator